MSVLPRNDTAVILSQFIPFYTLLNICISIPILLSPRKLYAISFSVSYGGYMRTFYSALATLKTVEFTTHIHKAVDICAVSIMEEFFVTEPKYLSLTRNSL
jgi:hypothetical protein